MPIELLIRIYCRRFEKSSDEMKNIDDSKIELNYNY